MPEKLTTTGGYADFQQAILDGDVPVDEALKVLHDDNDPSAILIAATHPQLPIHILHALAVHKDYVRRAAAAGSPSADAATLDRLSYDTKDSVVSTVAMNERTSAATLMRLWKERSELRDVLVYNRNLPTECLDDVVASLVSDAVLLWYMVRVTVEPSRQNSRLRETALNGLPGREENETLKAFASRVAKLRPQWASSARP